MFKLHRELRKYRELAHLTLMELQRKLEDPATPEDEKARIQKRIDATQQTCEIKINGKGNQDGR